MWWMVERGRMSELTQQEKKKQKTTESSSSPPAVERWIGPLRIQKYFEAIKTFATSEVGDSLVSLGHFAVPD